MGNIQIPSNPELEKNVASVLKKGLIAVVVIVALIVVGCGSFTVVEPNETAVVKNMGKIDRVIPRNSGVSGKLPFIESVISVPLTPQQLNMAFTVGDDGAITKDMQTIGMQVAIVYNFKSDEASVRNYVENYTASSLEKLFQTNVKSTIKEVIGKYSIYELTANTDQISKQVWNEMNVKCMKLPLEIAQLNVNNWDWSQEFDKQIQETMKRTQMEKTAKADVAIAEASAQKQVKEAEAEKQAAMLRAQADLEVTKMEAEAAKVKADADLYTKTKISQALVTNEKQWKHDETMLFLEKWNGKVPGADATTQVGGSSSSSMIDAIMAKTLSH